MAKKAKRAVKKAAKKAAKKKATKKKVAKKKKPTAKKRATGTFGFAGPDTKCRRIDGECLMFRRSPSGDFDIPMGKVDCSQCKAFF
jgi:hypothetical protein